MIRDERCITNFNSKRLVSISTFGLSTYTGTAYFSDVAMEKPNLLCGIGDLSIDAVRTSPYPTLVVPL